MSKQEFGVDIPERQQAEQARRRMDGLFRALIENALDVITILDAEGVIYYQSPSGERVLGYKPAELIGVNIVELLHPDDAPKVNAAIEAATPLNGTPGIALVMEARLRHKDGSWRILESIGKVLPSGLPVTGIVVNSRDITERKRAEEDLRLSEEKYRTLTESVAELVYRAEPETFVATYVNKAVEHICGYSVDEWLRDSSLWEKAIHPKDRERVLAVIGEAQKAARDSIVEYRIIRKDGETRWVIDHFVWEKDTRGKVVSLNGVMSDITERKRAEEALRESEEKYRNVVERANDGIVIIQDTIVKYLNPRLAEFWGSTVEEVIGTPFADFIHPDELPVVLDRYQRRMSGDDVTQIYETVLKRKDGSKAYVEINAGTIKYQGEPADLAIVRDITERKRAEEALRKKDEHHRNVVESIFRFVPEGLLVFTENLSLVKQNKAFEEITQQYAARLGYAEQELAELIAEQVRRKILSGDTTEIHIPKKRC